METLLRQPLLHSIIQYPNMSLQSLSFDHLHLQFRSNNTNQAMEIRTNLKLPKEDQLLARMADS